MSELSVELTAKINNLESQLKKAKKDLLATGEAAETASKKVRRGTQSFTGLKKGVVNATPTLQEFSRIIQDAPFGIQGVGNNIEQLTSNFGNLTRSAGGTIPALKAVLGAFLGPAGILFVVSAAVSLLTVYGDKLFSTKNKVDDLRKSLEKINTSFDAELGLNKQITENLNTQKLSTEASLKARREILQRQLASVGTILAENQALLTQLKIQNETVSNWELITGLTKKAAGFAILGLVGAYESSQKAIEAIRKPLEDLLGVEYLRSKVSGSSAKDKEREKELTDEVLKTQTQIQSIVGEILKINRGITEEKEKQLKTLRVDPTPKGLGDIFKIERDSFLPTGIEVLEKTGKDVAEKFLRGLNEINKANPIKTYLSDLEQVLLEFNENASNIISNNIASTFATLGDAIGEALATGGNVLQSIGQGILSSMGRFLSDMGDLLIKYGTLAVAKGKIDLAIAAGGPIAIGAGIAAIAVGIALKAAGAAIGRAAKGTAGSGGFSGGSVGGQSSGSFGGSSTVAGFGGGSGTVVFEIAGTKLVGVLQRTLSKNSRLGGSLGV